MKAVSEARQDGAGVRLGDAQILARSPTHATQHYKRASGNLDRHDVSLLHRLRRRRVSKYNARQRTV